MNDAVITDLKQFISAELTQRLSNVATKDDLKKLENKFDKLESKVDGLEVKVDGIQTFLEDSTMPYIGLVDDQVQKHDRRITKLEQKAV